MKKIVLMVAMVAACFSARAALEDRLWESQLLYLSPLIGGEVDGDGAGWYVEAFNITSGGPLLFGFDALGNPDSAEAVIDRDSAFGTAVLDISAGEPGVSPSLGWYDGSGYILNTSVFGPAKDLDTVQLVFYNNADKNAATWYITSLASALPDAPEVAGADDVKVTFDFTGKTWQAIPEPATALLFGIGGFGAWLLRRRQQA